MSDNELPAKPTLRHLELVWISAVTAVFLWIVSVGFAIADAIVPRLPDPLIIAGAVAAATLTLFAFGLRLAYSRQAESVAAHEQILAELTRTQKIAALTGEGVGRLAAEIEQVAARLGQSAELVNGDEIPPGVMAQVYQLGRKAGEKGADN